MKALKPSHREHKRYLLLEGKDVSNENVNKAILQFVGILGLAKSDPKYIKSKKNNPIYSINRKELDKVRASFLLSGLDIHIKKVSGILNKL